MFKICKCIILLQKTYKNIRVLIKRDFYFFKNGYIIYNLQIKNCIDVKIRKQSVVEID